MLELVAPTVVVTAQQKQALFALLGSHTTVLHTPPQGRLRRSAWWNKVLRVLLSPAINRLQKTPHDPIHLPQRPTESEPSPRTRRSIRKLPSLSLGYCYTTRIEALSAARVNATPRSARQPEPCRDPCDALSFLRKTTTLPTHIRRPRCTPALDIRPSNDPARSVAAITPRFRARDLLLAGASTNQSPTQGFPLPISPPWPLLFSFDTSSSPACHFSSRLTETTTNIKHSQHKQVTGTRFGETHLSRHSRL
jgi:hypothetical protein